MSPVNSKLVSIVLLQLEIYNIFSLGYTYSQYSPEKIVICTVIKDENMLHNCCLPYTIELNALGMFMEKWSD